MVSLLFGVWFLRRQRDYNLRTCVLNHDLFAYDACNYWGFSFSEVLVKFSYFFLSASWPPHSSQSLAAWKAAAHVPSQPANWRRCSPRPSCVNTMSGRLKKRSLQPMLMSWSGECQSREVSSVKSFSTRKAAWALSSGDENPVTKLCLPFFLAFLAEQ